MGRQDVRAAAMLPLSLSWDHRVIDGAAAARFNAYLRGTARRPAARASSNEGSQRWPTIEVKVPDIGDFKDVPVIEVLVKPGDTVAKPRTRSSRSNPTRRRWTCRRRSAGTVKELKVKVGDKVSEGTLIVVDGRSAAAAKPPPQRRAGAPPPAAAGGARSARRARRAAPAAPHPAPRRYTGKADIECEMLVLGAGPGGYSRRVPRRRPRHEDGARRALRDARRRVPQRRLHSVEGAAAHRGGDGRSEGARPSTASRSARRRSTSTSCAAGRTRWSAS